MSEQTFARIELDKYFPKNRPFDPNTDLRYRVVYENLLTGGVKKESFHDAESATSRQIELNEKYKHNKKKELSFLQATINDAIDVFINDGACKEYAQYFLPLIRKFVGEIKIRDLDEEHIGQFKVRLDNGRRCPRTLNGYLICLNTLLNHCKKKRLIESFPHIAFFVEKDKEVIRDRTVNGHEFLRLLLACRVKIYMVKTENISYLT